MSHSSGMKTATDSTRLDSTSLRSSPGFHWAESLAMLDLTSQPARQHKNNNFYSATNKKNIEKNDGNESCILEVQLLKS